MEGEDGYLLPSLSANKSTTTPSLSDMYYQNVCNDYQVPNPLPPKLNTGVGELQPPKLVPIIEKFPESDSKPVSPRLPPEDPSNFYQVPPTPVPLIPAPPICKVSPFISSVSTPTPPQHRLSGGSYLPMVPPLRKTKSEPRSAPSFTIPKSGSFSHFTTKYSDKVLAESITPAATAMSREELIKIYCQEEQSRPESTPPSLENKDPPLISGTPPNIINQPPRPDSTPPNINYYQNQEQSCILSHCIGIPSRSDSFSSAAGGIRVQLESETEQSNRGSPLDHHVHTDTGITLLLFVILKCLKLFCLGLVYLPIESQDTDSELTSYFEAGKISEQALLSYRKNSISLDTEQMVGIKNRNNNLAVEDGEVGKVLKILGRLSPARSRLGFNMGSLRRRPGRVRTGPQCDDNDNIIDDMDNSDSEPSEAEVLSVEALKDSVLNLSNSRCSSLKNIFAPLPPKTLHSNTLPSPEKRIKPPVSSSLYDIPRHLSNNNTGDYILAENTLSPPATASKSKGASPSPVKNRNAGAYENVKIIPIEKEK